MSLLVNGLPNPLPFIAGNGLADALADFLAPAAQAPGTPPTHKNWQHLAQYLREDTGAEDHLNRCAALLCSRSFRKAWFVEVAPHLPRVRIPLFVRLLMEAINDGTGQKALADLQTLLPSSTVPLPAWKFPNAQNQWIPEENTPAFSQRWFRPTDAPDLSQSYQDWFSEFGRDMWHIMKSVGDKDIQATLLQTSLQLRMLFFNEEELSQIEPHLSPDFSLRKEIAGWLREAHIAPDRASTIAQTAATTLAEMRVQADQAVLWITKTEAGRDWAAPFANEGFEKAMNSQEASEIQTSLTFARVDTLDTAVPKLKALIALLANRQTQSQKAILDFVQEAGQERITLMREGKNILDEDAFHLTENKKSR